MDCGVWFLLYATCVIWSAFYKFLLICLSKKKKAQDWSDNRGKSWNEKVVFLSFLLVFFYIGSMIAIWVVSLQFIFISDQDSVRLLAVEGCAALGKLLEPQDCVAHILPVIVNFSQVHP